MNKILVVDYGEYEFVNFDTAIKTLEKVYGYEGMAWDKVVANRDNEMLRDFLIDDGVEAELI